MYNVRAVGALIAVKIRQETVDGTTCIACHYNLVHKEVEPSAAFLKAIEKQ